jgi:Ca-activated chloride channel homolog
MKSLKRMVCWSLAVGVSLFLAGSGRTGPGEDEAGSDARSPYFFLPGDAGVESFPLLETGAEVDISGVIAEVALTQVYKNEGDQTIEAVYVFPLGVKSAIHSMKMTIGDRVIEAEIEEKARARAIYQAARDEGQVASLLEQERPNVFRMQVANIMPGDRVEVEVGYTELLVPEEGVYRYVFPAVVGPRFTGEKETDDADAWTATPYLREGEDAPYGFDIRVNLNAGLPITDFRVGSHRVEVNRPAADRAVIALADSEENGGNRDFILEYSLQGAAVQSGLLLYPGREENYFLLMLEPPRQVTAEMIPPREYLFIVDVSGSMHGFPLDVSKSVIDKLLGGLRPDDYFNILFFSGGSRVLSPVPLPATEENRAGARAMLQGQQGGGGTRILNALQTALALEKREGLSRVIVMVTDGYVSVEKETFDLIREKAGEANFFAFGIGTSVNRYLIEGMARIGRGEPFIVTGPDEAEEVAGRFLRYIQSPLLTDIKVEFEGFDAYEVEPPALPDLFAERPLILFGKYRRAEGKIKVTGRTSGGVYVREFAVSPQGEDKKNSALQYLWAREKIARLADYGRVGLEVREEVTGLGLKYHLMTEYTSFVAVDTVIRDTGEIVTVKQPLPLPQGVSNLAVEDQSRVRYCGVMKNAPGVMSLTMAREEARADFRQPAAEPRISVSGGTIPRGMTLAVVEKTLLDQAGAELEKTFSEWELESLSLLLTVEKGRITAVRIEGYRGRTCREEVLEKIFRKLTFPGSPGGTMAIELIYG